VRALAATFWTDGTGDERDAWPWWRSVKFKRAKSLTVIIAHGARYFYRLKTSKRTSGDTGRPVPSWLI
jgi:hypothetical protein